MYNFYYSEWQVIIRINMQNLQRVFSSCERLEEINLMNLEFNSDITKELTLCKNLKQVHLLYAPSFAVLEQCPKLQTIYVFQGFNRRSIARIKRKYPHVIIHEYRDKQKQ